MIQIRHMGLYKEKKSVRARINKGKIIFKILLLLVNLKDSCLKKPIIVTEYGLATAYGYMN